MNIIGILDEVREDFSDRALGGWVGGSWSRGTADRWSDVDVDLVVDEVGEVFEASFYRSGRLWTVCRETVSSSRAALRDPEAAPFLVPDLSSAKVAFDHHGHVASLIEEAKAFDWSLDPERVATVHEKRLIGAVEDAQKVAGAIESGSIERGWDAHVVVVMATAETLTLFLKVLVESQGSLFSDLSLAAPSDPAVTDLRIATGLVEAPTIDRYRAALRAFVSVAGRAAPSLSPRGRETLEEAVRRLRNFH